MAIKLAEAFVRLFADQTALKADLAAAQATTAAAATKIAADFKAKARLEMPNGAGPAIAQIAGQVSALDQRFLSAQTAASALEAQIAAGSPRMASGQARLVTTMALLKEEIDRVRVAGGQMTSDQVRQYAMLDAAVVANAAKVRELRNIQTLAKGTVSEAGVAYAASGGLRHSPWAVA